MSLWLIRFFSPVDVRGFGIFLILPVNSMSRFVSFFAFFLLILHGISNMIGYKTETNRNAKDYNIWWSKRKRETLRRLILKFPFTFPEVHMFHIRCMLSQHGIFIWTIRVVCQFLVSSSYSRGLERLQNLQVLLSVIGVRLEIECFFFQFFLLYRMRFCCMLTGKIR